MTRKICPVCDGRGKIRNPKVAEGYTPFDKDITCPNCQGEGFIGLPDVLPIKKPFYRTKLTQKTSSKKEQVGK